MSNKSNEKTIRVIIWSYKKAQHFKKDYVRMNGDFLRFKKSSGNHSNLVLDLEEGDEFDARASRYDQSKTGSKWDAHNCQSWAKFKVENGELIAMDFDRNQVTMPHWVLGI